MRKNAKYNYGLRSYNQINQRILNHKKNLRYIYYFTKGKAYFWKGMSRVKLLNIINNFISLNN